VPVTIETFWAIVEKIGWGTKTTDYEAVRAGLMKGRTPAECDELRGILLSKRTRLVMALADAERLEKIPRLPVSDDGLCDLTNHVVGLGRKAYEGALADPRWVYDLALANGYKESFAYCFPHPEDWVEAERGPAIYAERLGRGLAAIQAEHDKVAVRLGHFGPDLAFLTTMQTRLAAGDVEYVLGYERQFAEVAERNLDACNYLLHNVLADLKRMVKARAIEPI